MGSLNEIGQKDDWQNTGFWNAHPIVCQQPHSQAHAFWSKHDRATSSPSYISMTLFTLSIILLISNASLFLLKPLKMPFTAQMIGGVLVIGLFSLFGLKEQYMLFPYVVQYILKTISFLGFILHSLMLGVETNMMSVIKRMKKQSAIIGFSGFFVSIFLSTASVLFFAPFHDLASLNPGFYRLSMLTAQNFFMVTCNHLNDLGISNSELGRLAYTISLCLDVSGMAVSIIMFDIIPLFAGQPSANLMTVVLFYSVIFCFVRPYILSVIDRCEDPKKVTVTHLALLVVIVILIAIIGELLGQMFPVFLFALSLPEDPLSSVLIKWLDTITFGLFFPMYCAMQGQQVDIKALEPTTAFRIEFTLVFASIGKFFGTYLSSLLVGLPTNNALALSIVMSSKGLFDIVSLGLWKDSRIIDVHEYTVATFHFLVCTGVLLPLVRYLYHPSSEYSNILGTSVMDICENGALKTMACIHRKDNVPGVIRLIEAFGPSRSRPVPLIALQLIQLTGRVSMPVLGLLDQVKSSGVLGQKLIRCEDIVDSLTLLERMHKGDVRIQHYVSVASHDTMHNDICTLAYDKDINLLIIPFHATSLVTTNSSSDSVSDAGSVLAIRSVNQKILEHSPCAVGILIDRAKSHHVGVSMTRDYRIAIIYIGGMDDREGLAYMNLFTTNPNISVQVSWLKSPYNSKENPNSLDCELIDEIRTKMKMNERLSLDEVVVQDGAETTDYLVSIKDKFDLVVGGRYHDPSCGPLFGLSDCWSTEYPELGILGDLLASTDFQFSVLIVHSSVERDHN